MTHVAIPNDDVLVITNKIDAHEKAISWWRKFDKHTFPKRLRKYRSDQEEA